MDSTSVLSIRNIINLFTTEIKQCTVKKKGYFNLQLVTGVSV